MSRRIFALWGWRPINQKAKAWPAGRSRSVQLGLRVRTHSTMTHGSVLLSKDFTPDENLIVQPRNLKETGGTPSPAFSKPEWR